MKKTKTLGRALMYWKRVLLCAAASGGLIGMSVSARALSADVGTPPNVIKFAKYVVGVKDLDKAYAYYHALGAELVQTGSLGKPAPISPTLQKLYDVPAGTQFRSATLKLPASDVAMQLVEFTNLKRSSGGPRFHDPGAVQLIMEVFDVGPELNTAKSFGRKVVTVGGAPVEIGFPGDPAPAQAVVVDDLDGHYVEFVKVNPDHVVNKYGETPIVDKMKEAKASSSNFVFTSFRTVVEDIDRAAEFYRGEHFGLVTVAGPWDRNAENLMRMSGVTSKDDARVGEMRTRDTKPMRGWTFFATTAKDATPYKVRLPDPGGYAIGLEVRDLPAAVSAIQRSGGSVITSGDGRLQTPSGDAMVLARDSNGILLELVQRAAKD